MHGHDMTTKRKVQDMTTETVMGRRLIDVRTTDQVDTLVAQLEIVRSSTPTMADMVPQTTLEALVRDLWTDRGGKLRMRKSLPSGASSAARALHGQLKWHQGGGDLHGLYFAKFAAADDAEWNLVSDVSALIMVAFGQQSRALGAWKATGLVGGVS